MTKRLLVNVIGSEFRRLGALVVRFVRYLSVRKTEASVVQRQSDAQRKNETNKLNVLYTREKKR